MPDAATTTQTWAYAGRRLAKGGKSYIHAWVDHAGKERYFKGLRGSVIGGVYTIEAELRDGDTVARQGTLAYTGETHPGADDVSAWRTADAAASYELEQAKAERRAAAAGDELERALDVLRRHYQAGRSYHARWAFQQWVAAEVSRPAGEGGL